MKFHFRRLLLIFYVFSSLLSYAFASKSYDCHISDFGQLNDTLNSCSPGFNHSTGHQAKRSIRSVIISASDTTLLPNLVKQTPNVTRIHIQSNATSIDYEEVCSWHSLEQIKLSGRALTRLPSRFLSKCQKTFLLFLELKKINFIAADAFDGMPELSSIFLSRNEIKQLHKDTFKSLAKLDFLDLSYNKLQMIDSDLFDHNPKLKTLYLSFNDLKRIGHGAFRMMRVSSDLWLRGNIHLESIDLTNQQIVSEEEKVYDKNIFHLYGEGESIGSRVDLSGSGLKTLFIPTHVKDIEAGQNQITSIKVDPNNRLNVLSVPNNKLSSVGNLTLPFLKTINVRGNSVMLFSEFYSFKQLFGLEFDLNLEQKFNYDEIHTNLPSLWFVSLWSPSMTNDQQNQIINNFKQYNITCAFNKQMF